MLRIHYIKLILALMALLSLNVNGLRDIDKMNSVFTIINMEILYFYRKPFGIMILSKDINIYGRVKYIIIIVQTRTEEGWLY